jgi:hypothetical protein
MTQREQNNTYGLQFENNNEKKTHRVIADLTPGALVFEYPPFYLLMLLMFFMFVCFCMKHYLVDGWVGVISPRQYMKREL